MSKIIQEIEKQRMTRAVPEFKPGDTVVVQVKVVEGDRERVQAYEGVVIARSNRGLNSSFTVRKISHGEGVERVFQTYSPSISDITVKRRGNVRRANGFFKRVRLRPPAFCRRVVVGLDNARDEFVADNVGGREVDMGNPFDAFQQLYRFGKA